MTVIYEGISMEVESVNYECNNHTGCNSDTVFEGGNGPLQCGGSVKD